MSILVHSVFNEPEDREIKIWRYMDFTKFVFSLEKSGLFFSRLDRLGDPFEGSVPRKNLDSRLEGWKKHLDEENVQAIQLRFPQFLQWQRQWTYVTCWHMNESESAAMWRLYARTEEAICIQSTYERLRECLDEAPCEERDQIFLGTVKYIDYEGECLPNDNSLNHLVYKRRSFEHERELRALVYRYPYGAGSDFPPDLCKDDHPKDLPKEGIWVKLHLDRLVENIYVAPASPKWFRDLVEKVANRYALKKPVSHSLLDGSPIY